MKQLGSAAAMALSQQMAAAQRALAAEARLRLLVRLSGQVALPMGIAYPAYGVPAARYGVRPMLQVRPRPPRQGAEAHKR